MREAASAGSGSFPPGPDPSHRASAGHTRPYKKGAPESLGAPFYLSSLAVDLPQSYLMVTVASASAPPGNQVPVVEKRTSIRPPAPKVSRPAACVAKLN